MMKPSYYQLAIPLHYGASIILAAPLYYDTAIILSGALLYDTAIRLSAALHYDEANVFINLSRHYKPEAICVACNALKVSRGVDKWT